MDTIRQKLALFIENNQMTKNDQLLNRENGQISAFFYTFYNRRINCAAIRDNHNMIANHPDVRFFDTGSQVATLLSLYDNSAELLERINVVYSLLVEKAGFWHDSHYIGFTSYLIVTGTAPENYQNVVARTSDFYKGMVEKNFGASEASYPYAALFGLSNIDVMYGLGQIEQLFQWYKTALKARNALFIPSVREIAMILIFNDLVDRNRVIELKNTIKPARVLGIKIAMWDAIFYDIVGILAQLPASASTLSQELDEVQKFLKTQKGFSQMFLSVHGRYLTSTSIIANAYLDEVKRNGSVADIASFERMIITRQFTGMFGSFAAELAAHFDRRPGSFAQERHDERWSRQ